MQAAARSRVGGWLFIKVFPAIDRRLMPLSDGRLKVAMGQPILLPYETYQERAAGRAIRVIVLEPRQPQSSLSRVMGRSRTRRPVAL